MEVAVEMREVGLAYGGNVVLDGLNLRVARGDILILLGESGSGKTTTLKLVNRLVEPSKGEVLVEGRATRNWNPIQLRRRIGYVVQDAGLFPHYTVARNVGLVPTLENWDEPRKTARIKDMLELVGLSPAKYAGRFPSELSGGERQRVGVARALAGDPDLLLLDEPFGALDPITRANLQDEFLRLVTTLKKTAIFVTHDLNEALRLGTTVCLLQQGRIVEQAPPEAFVRSAKSYVQEYVKTIRIEPKS